MYQQSFYKDCNNKKIEEAIREEGFDPVIINNSPGYIYPEHSHPQSKLLAFLEGSMEVIVNGKVYMCTKGDKLIIPGNIKHSAVVGSRGCVFFWAER